MSAPYL